MAATLPDALVGVFYDDGLYVTLAKSLAEGRGYHFLHLPGAPPAVHYPVLYPAFLAALWKLAPSFPQNVGLFRAASAALMGLAAAAVVAYLGGRLLLKRWALAGVVVLAATAIPLLAVATALFAEPLFLALAVLACWAADAASGAATRRGALAMAALAGGLAGSAALTRSIGIAVVAGVVAASLAARRGRGAVVSAASAVLLFAPWAGWVAARASAVDPLTVSNYGTYADLVSQAGWSWLSVGVLADVLRPLGAVTLHALGPLRFALAVPTLAALVVGLVALPGRAPALGWTLIAYLLVVSLWPYGPDRFLWAALPWLAVAFAVGIHVLWRPAGRARWTAALARGVAIVAAGSVLFGFGVYQVRGLRAGAATREQVAISETFRAVLPWIREETPRSAVIASEDEALVWLYSERRAVPSYLWRVSGRGARSFGPDSLRAYFDRMGVTHVILTGPGSDAAPTIDAMVARFPGYLRLVRVWPGQILAFAVERGG